MINSSNMNDMQKREAIKRRQFAFRLNIFFFSVFLLFSILIVRLAILQFVEGTDIQAHRWDNEMSSMDIPPIRGNIYDYNGFPIAYSTSTQSLYYRYQLDQKKEDVIEMAFQISRIIDEHRDEGTTRISPEDILKIMDVGFDLEGNHTTILNYYSSPRRIKTNLSKSEMAYISEHRDVLKGIEIVEESVRNYAEERIAVQLVGYLRQFSTARNQSQSYLDFYRNREFTGAYLDIETVGFDGLEFMYQEQLRGINGSKSFPVNALGQIAGKIEVINPTKGNNLYLTIDKNVQLKTEKAIKEHLEFMKSEDAGKTFSMGEKATTGYAVAMEVETGKVMAMASFPDYDPNIWTGGVSQAIYDENVYFIKNGTISEAYPNYPDYAERAKHPTSLVPIGSSIKPLTVLLGLREQLITPQNTYQDTGVFYFGRDNLARIRNSNSTAHGKINALEAIRRSSNTFMSAMIGNPLYLREGNNGINIWDQYMESFGLGVLTGSGLPNEIRGTKEYMNLERAGSAQSALVFASWGQQGRYTALQLAQFTTMLANKGKRLQPLFVDRITTAQGETIETYEPVILGEDFFDPNHWVLVHDSMKLVNKQGFDDFPYTIASKTGTSQQDVAGGRIENAIFIAFAPAENPKLAVAVIVPEGGFGGFGAAPIARKIFDAYDEVFGLIDSE